MHRNVIKLLFILAIGLVACSPYRAAWGTLDTTAKLQATADQRIADKATAAHAACLQKGLATYRECIAKDLKAAQVWTQHVYPNMTAARRIAAFSIALAEKKKNKKLDWKKLLRAIGCVAAGVGQDLSHYIPDEMKLLRSAFDGLGALTCTKPKPVDPGTVIGILVPITELIAYIAKSLGEPLAVIRTRVQKALEQPAKSAVLPVLERMQAACTHDQPSN